MLSTLMGKYRYSIQDVHEKTGLSRNTISNLYNDKASRVDYETVEKLCKLFACSINELFEISTAEIGLKESNNTEMQRGVQ